MTDAAKKLADGIKPTIVESEVKITGAMNVNHMELIALLKEIQVEVQVLSKSVAGQKKTVTKAPKAEPTSEAASGDITVEPSKTKFAINSNVWFKAQYKASAEFRTKYVNEKLRALMDADTTIKSKTNDDQRHVAESTFAWTWIKTNDDENFKAIKKEYDEKKAAHESANKPAQQTAEQHTPVEAEKK
jgi:hypothetical protein